MDNEDIDYGFWSDYWYTKKQVDRLILKSHDTMPECVAIDIVTCKGEYMAGEGYGI